MAAEQAGELTDGGELVAHSAFHLLETATAPGTIHDTAHLWSEDDAWMRAIFSEEQPFLSEEAEAQRQQTLAQARAQKRG